eukprot:6175317-Pleurochrysis_carterae.AAC.1
MSRTDDNRDVMKSLMEKHGVMTIGEFTTQLKPHHELNIFVEHCVATRPSPLNTLRGRSERYVQLAGSLESQIQSSSLIGEAIFEYQLNNKRILQGSQGQVSRGGSIHAPRPPSRAASNGETAASTVGLSASLPARRVFDGPVGATSPSTFLRSSRFSRAEGGAEGGHLGAARVEEPPKKREHLVRTPRSSTQSLTPQLVRKAIAGRRCEKSCYSYARIMTMPLSKAQRDTDILCSVFAGFALELANDA